MGKMNARMASHFRRLQMASSPSRPAPFSVPSALGSLRSEDEVAVLEVEVLLLSGELVVVERNLLHRRPRRPEDDDSRACGELREPTGQSKGVQDGRPALQLEATRAGDFADDRHFEAPDVRHDHGDLRAWDVLPELLCQNLAELERGETGGLDVVQKGQ